MLQHMLYIDHHKVLALWLWQKDYNQNQSCKHHEIGSEGQQSGKQNLHCKIKQHLLQRSPSNYRAIAKRPHFCCRKINWCETKQHKWSTHSTFSRSHQLWYSSRKQVDSRISRTLDYYQILHDFSHWHWVIHHTWWLLWEWHSSEKRVHTTLRRRNVRFVSIKNKNGLLLCHDMWHTNTQFDDCQWAQSCFQRGASQHW